MAKVILTRGYTTMVDEADLHRVAAYSWIAHTSSSGLVYAARWVNQNGRQKRILLHRWLLDATPTQQIDHCDRDTLNNRRVNLRFATQAENNRNRMFGKRASGRKGVYRNGAGWLTRICVNGQRLNLGTHAERDAAAGLYDLAARTFHKEFAATNFPTIEEAMAAVGKCPTAIAAASSLARFEGVK